MVSTLAAYVDALCLVIGTLRPNYLVGEIKQAYKKRKEKHDIKTEQYIKMCPTMMQLVSPSFDGISSMRILLSSFSV